MTGVNQLRFSEGYVSTGPEKRRAAVSADAM